LSEISLRVTLPIHLTHQLPLRRHNQMWTKLLSNLVLLYGAIALVQGNLQEAGAEVFGIWDPKFCRWCWCPEKSAASPSSSSRSRWSSWAAFTLCLCGKWH